MLDVNKPVQCRDGRKARILATDIKGPLSLAAVVVYTDGVEAVFSFYPDGRTTHAAPSALDLVNAPRSHEDWALWIGGMSGEVYVGGTYSTEEKAKLAAARQRVRCAAGSTWHYPFAIQKRTVTEGEGL